MRLTDEGGDKRRRTSQGLPLIRPSVRTGAPSPLRGRLGVRSNREGFCPLWDVWIHILGIVAECACWGAGGPVCRPYGGNVVSPGGTPSRRALQRRWREPAPSSAPFGGSFPYPLSPFGTSSLPLLAFGHFPLTGGIGPLTRGVGPQREGMTGG